ncbi:E3 ubiquitin-protein ligase LRSAM1 [Lethenteron reissneri]|uniref:E3 ubiquitin-protein ligase LRSAM1 n=1 Tax=Lethenteron reissneri TaxID=7753 RepID=UPI002AB7C946|nr:E3 ubiquitin-protein ligase LRSAM1 [Lethenteron reissneri]
MPLFGRKKPSRDADRRLQLQLCLAKEAGADDVLDASQCDLTEIPSAVYSTCRVLQKKVLILHTNCLTSLTSGGNILDFSGLKVLDLHANKLKALPEEMWQLSALQVLNVEGNNLMALPESVVRLRQLQTLNVRDNKISELPKDLDGLQSLRNLDISLNQISKLPLSLAHIRTLETLQLDVGRISFPPQDVVRQGTEAVKRFLCEESGLEYSPPSQHLLSVLTASPQRCPDVTDNAELQHSLQQAAWQDKFKEFENKKEMRRKEQLEFERALGQQHMDMALLVNDATLQRDELLHSVKEGLAELEREVDGQRRRQDATRVRMTEELLRMEKKAGDLVSHILSKRDWFKQKKDLLEAMDRERLEMELLVCITQEETLALRRNDVAAAMQQMLMEAKSNELLRQEYQRQRDELCDQAASSLTEQEEKLQCVVSGRHDRQKQAIASILQEELIQKEAFEMLQLQRDAWHSRIRNQIGLIEQELLHISMLEMKRKGQDQEQMQGVLVEERQALGDLLHQLLKEKGARELQLQDLLEEMEKKREEDSMDYWLVQYQRLMQSKPQPLRLQESLLDVGLQELLTETGSPGLIPLFARHRVSLAALAAMMHEDLIAMGLADEEVRVALIKGAQQRVESQAKLGPSALASATFASLPAFATGRAPVEPTAPAVPEWPSPTWTPPPLSPLPPLSPSPWAEQAECVVCMERKPETVFLTCGHVCCCAACGALLTSCPLCRADIQSQVRLYRLL